MKSDSDELYEDIEHAADKLRDLSSGYQEEIERLEKEVSELEAEKEDLENRFKELEKEKQ